MRKRAPVGENTGYSDAQVQHLPANSRESTRAAAIAAALHLAGQVAGLTLPRAGAAA